MAESKGSGLAVALNGYGLIPPGGRPEVLSWEALVGIAETAEEVGYEAVFLPEIGAREGFATATGLAGVTAGVRLATGVLPIGSRDERRTAMGAATVHDVSGGRFVLGLGSLASIEETRRYLTTVRSLLAGGEAEPARPGTSHPPLDLLPGPGHVPVILAALGPRMTRLAGEAADGVLLNWCTPERVALARRQTAQGAEGAGRDPREITVAVYVRTVVGHEGADAAAALRGAAAAYAAMPKYLRQYEAMGLGEEARAAALGPERVPETLLRACCVWGERGEALARLDAYREAGADLVVVYPVPVLEAESSITGTVLGAAPHPAVER
jgi:alkanesulfonate monooxygenase SsuD/methylene tetrahydromethanopterin reductase-like flavin-dependent oxidoreductase (luciferase family)